MFPSLTIPTSSSTKATCSSNRLRPSKVRPKCQSPVCSTRITSPPTLFDKIKSFIEQIHNFIQRVYLTINSDPNDYLSSSTTCPPSKKNKYVAASFRCQMVSTACA
ncbi:DUF2990 domain-containing protein [Paenibacillus sp. N10]|uniref:DUF2990 domain-containing protein n=1 Tax=Paenibacillus lutrae TaxID=2078573 RepID=A0A7X3JYW9_9BACL|nr:DUF2990 domain-containing protein [Paenibacillus lutrae]